LVTISNTSVLFGAYYSSIPYKSDGVTKRSAVDKARMQLVQQLVTAKLNVFAFGGNSTIKTLIVAADNAYAGTNTNLMLSLASKLDAYNNGGDPYPLPVYLGSPGPATPDLSKSIANKKFWDTP